MNKPLTQNTVKPLSEIKGKLVFFFNIYMFARWFVDPYLKWGL